MDRREEAERIRKKEIRRECRMKRENQPEKEREEKSRLICRKVLDLPVYQASSTILVYIETQGEVSLDGVIRAAWKDGKTVASPRCHGKTMDFYRIRSYEDLETGTFGVREPKDGCEMIIPDPSHTLLLAPGVAFDRRGGRVGYGGGFYDRYLAEHPGLHTVGIGFAFQIYDTVPGEPTDIPLEQIVTETDRSETDGAETAGIL